MKLESAKQSPSQTLDDPGARLPRVPFSLSEALISLAIAPRPSELFEEGLRGAMLPEADAHRVDVVNYEGFRVVPMFLDAGWMGVPGAVFNKQLIASEFPDYLPSDNSSKTSSAIFEAARNVAQHGAPLNQLPPAGSVCFAPGAIFLQELYCRDDQAREHRFLVCMISDEGMGIADPSRSLLPGVGSPWGENHNGLGYELRDSVLMLIRARERGWLLFDGLHHQSTMLAKANAPDEHLTGVPPLAELQLPSHSRGCQKIFIFQHPSSDAEAVFRIAMDSMEPFRR